MEKFNSKSLIINDIQDIFQALEFAALKHRSQKRKGFPVIPYINHPIQVANVLVKIVEPVNKNILIAALLHDTLEDTNTSYSEICEIFGKFIADIIRELTDDMKLPAMKRRQVQVQKAKNLSYDAKCIKIADKLCNIRDMLHSRAFFKKYKIAYIQWGCQVVDQLKGTHAALEAAFYELIKEAEGILRVKFILAKNYLLKDRAKGGSE